MNTIKQVLGKKDNVVVENLEPDCPPSPSIVNVFVMDKNDTKVTFKDSREIEQDGSEKTISLVLREQVSEDIFDIEEFLGKELAEFYKECKNMETKIGCDGGWKLTSDLLHKLPKMK